MPKVEATSDEIRDLIAYLNAATPSGAAELGAGISFAEVAHPKRGTWPTYDGNQSGNRFSPLKQIRHQQRRAPGAQMDVHHSRRPRALEVTPVVVDGVMYVTVGE